MSIMLAHVTGVPHHAEEFNLLGFAASMGWIAILLATNWVRAKLKLRTKQVKITINK